ncbi:hypothetical protein [Bacillus safensis]|uniref:hypothetical protein n=1 Tax=Bacillus safensis TaxID=561879 RepID=UPI0012689D67|nr:hypothetical protein [Bacillus safensis]
MEKPSDASLIGTAFDYLAIFRISRIINKEMRFEEKFTDRGFVKTDSKVVINPHFGIASLLVDGADADILVGDVLYDFKVVKDVGYKSMHVLQLTGYFLLNRLLKEIEHNYGESESLPFDNIEFIKQDSIIVNTLILMISTTKIFVLRLLDLLNTF